MQISHIGNNVWVISQLPWGVYGDPRRLLNYIKENRKRYVVAFTANMGQEKAREVLKKAKFNEVVTFKSYHGGRETLTLWLKISKSAKEDSTAPIGMLGFGRNCSISLNTKYIKNCTIATVENKNYKKIDKTPLYVRIASRNVKKGTKLFPKVLWNISNFK